MKGRKGEEESTVTLPHLDNSYFTVLDGDHQYKVLRWSVIKQEMQNLKEWIISGSGENSESIWDKVEACILSYNPGLDCSFGILKEALSTCVEEKVGDILSCIIEYALAIPTLIPGSIELLKGERTTEIITLTKDQACSILANAFFCTFPGREANRNKYLEYPRINFTALFDDKLNAPGLGWQSRFRSAKVEKVKCFLNYFERMKTVFGREGYPSIVFERRSLPIQDFLPEWSSSSKTFSSLEVHNKGVIENCAGALQVEFANKFVGGGTLGNGAAMEEIRFTCCPELVCSQLFTKVLEPLEALLVHNFEQFSNYSGYAASFKFEGDCFQNLEEVYANHVVCMDAYHFPRDSIAIQMEKKWLDRELNKCLVSFKKSEMLQDSDVISSGKWGCGVFNGNPLLKSLIQWMAASHCGKKLVLYTFADYKLTKELRAINKEIERSGCSVGKLYKIILGCPCPLNGDFQLNKHIERSICKRGLVNYVGSFILPFTKGPGLILGLICSSFLALSLVPRRTLYFYWSLVWRKVQDVCVFIEEGFYPEYNDMYFEIE